MPKFNPYTDAAKKAAGATDEEFASEISSLCRLKDEEINKLFPKREDKEKLINLLSIVNSSTSQNQKIIKLRDNIEDLAGVAIKLIGALA